MSSFEYKDEDGDRITVKSDDELHAMINFHISMPLSFNQSQQGTFIGENQDFVTDMSQHHLLIYPKICKHPKLRNKHDLRVAVAPTASSLLLADTSSHTMQQSYPNGMSVSGSKRPFIPIPSEQHNTEKPKQQNTVLNRTLNLQLGTLGNDALMFLEILGNGNSGVVRKAVHRESNTVTAVKSITLDLTGEEQQQILRELEILRR